MNDVSLRWLGTAGFLIEHHGNRLLIDPFLSRPAGADPVINLSTRDFQDVSLIMISHGHFDHSMDAGEIALENASAVYAPSISCRHYKRQGVTPSRLFELETSETIEWFDGKISVIPSRHIRFDGLMILSTLWRSLSGGIFWRLLSLILRFPIGGNYDFLIELGDHRILYSGSGGSLLDSCKKTEPTCLLLPFAGRSKILEYYLPLFEEYRPKSVILHHFDCFFPHFAVSYPAQRFKEALNQRYPDITVIIPRADQPSVLK